LVLLFRRSAGDIPWNLNGERVTKLEIANSSSTAEANVFNLSLDFIYCRVPRCDFLPDLCIINLSEQRSRAAESGGLTGVGTVELELVEVNVDADAEAAIQK
jgi:hypothetical protein